MTRVVIVLPSIVPEMTQACLASLHPSIIDPAAIPSPPTRQREAEVRIVNGAQWSDGSPEVRLVVVWNTPEHNAGVGQSWEIGRQEVLRTKAHGLTILSAAVRFGESGGRDWLDAIARAHEADTLLGLEADDGLGWHLLWFPRHVLEKVGAFDPIFWPAYSEDLDYSRRIQLAYGVDSTAPDFVGPLWPKVSIDATLTETAHGILRGGVVVDFEGIASKYLRKWGGLSPHEKYEHPYDRPELDWTFTGEPAA